jgi:hypothetical protein
MALALLGAEAFEDVVHFGVTEVHGRTEPDSDRQGMYHVANPHATGVVARPQYARLCLRLLPGRTLMHTSLRSWFVHAAAIAVCLVVALDTAPAYAQAPDAAAQQPPATPPAPPDPNKLVWTTTATVGFTKMAGPVDATNFNAVGEIEGIADSRSFSLQGDHTYGKYFGQTSADQQHVKFTVRQDVAEHVYLVARPSFERNKVQSINYLYEELVGAGFWRAGAKGRLDLVPVVGLVQQKKNIEEIDGNHFTAGILEIFNARLTPLWTLSQSFVYMKNSGSGDDSRMQANASLTGVVWGPLAVSLSYQAEHDSIILETVGGSKTAQTFTVGVQLQFPRRP